MSRRVTTWVVVLVLCAVGGVLVWLRTGHKAKQQRAPGETYWRLTYDVEVQPDTGPTRLRVALPQDTRHIRVFRETLYHPGMRIDVQQSPRARSRVAVGVAKGSRTQSLRATFELRVSPRERWPARPGPSELTADQRAHYLRAQPLIEVKGEPVADRLRRLSSDSPKPGVLVDRIHAFCGDDLTDDASPRGAAATLEQGRGSVLGRLRAMVALCRAARIPARIATGVMIEETDAADPAHWVEVRQGSRWVPYDPVNGYARRLPSTALPAQRDGPELVTAENAASLAHQVRIEPIPAPGGLPGVEKKRWTHVFDLTRLPIGFQDTLAILLLLPIGALVTAVFRQILGLMTFGTFTPTLFALAFVYADWRTGLVMFLSVLLLGLLVRVLLDRLKLLMVPRLSVVLTLVVLLIVFGVALLDHLGLTPSVRAVLLPMVILSMMVERFYITVEEDGMKQAAVLLLRTTIVAAGVYGILRWKELGQLILEYPEGHCFTAAALVWVGRYSGYRLSELWRFSDLARAK